MTSTDKVKEFNDSNFNEAIDKGVSLVDFWAAWCMPCRMQGPIIDKVADEVDSNVNVGKLNVDKYPSIAGKYGVMSIPTIIVFKDGKPAKTFVGVQSERVLLEAIKEVA